jgi:hypothetical protein
MDVREYGAGETALHCNHYLRLAIPECTDTYMLATKERYKILSEDFDQPKTEKDVVKMLGDQTGKDHWIFRDMENAGAKTVCVGIFDLRKKTWALYKSNPKTSDPLVVLPLVLKN